MIRSLRVPVFLVAALVVGGVAAPALSQSYGAMPRGYCVKKSVRLVSAPRTVAPQVEVYHRPAVSEDYSAPVGQTQRSRRARSLPSRF